MAYQTIEKADQITLEYNQWFDVAREIKSERDKQLRQNLKEFTESMPKSFRIAAKRTYLVAGLEKLSSLYHNIPSEGKDSDPQKKIECARLIKKFKVELSMLEQPDSKRLTESQIQQASEIDCSIFFDKVKRSGNNKIIKCIFHTENTPSMVLFKDKGFHCFGCQKHGTAIDIAMELYHLDFVAAVRKLL